MHQPTDRITHTTAFVTPVVEHWLEREIAQWLCFRVSIIIKEKEEMIYLTMQSTQFIYDYMASDIWLRTTGIMI